MVDLQDLEDFTEISSSVDSPEDLAEFCKCYDEKTQSSYVYNLANNIAKNTHKTLVDNSYENPRIFMGVSALAGGYLGLPISVSLTSAYVVSCASYMLHKN